MLHRYKVLTITHRFASLEEIGRFVLPEASAPYENKELWLKIQSAGLAEELMYLATCNRVLYFFTSDEEINASFIRRFISSLMPALQESDLSLLMQRIQVFEGAEAIRHLYEVSSSIDSLVVGEREILRQLREAFEKCKALGVTGDELRLALRFTVETAKAVYSETKIGEKPVSVVSLAMQQMMNLHPKLDSRIWLVGAGQTNTLVAKFLQKYGFSKVKVFNRTLKNAERIAAIFNGSAYSLDELPHQQEGFDMMIVCTGANEAIIHRNNYSDLLNGDTNPKILIDLSVPHNIEAGLEKFFNLHFINVEGLQLLAKENMSFRLKETKKAKQLIAKRVDEFSEHFRQRKISQALSHIPEQIKKVKRHAIEKVFEQELEQLNEETRDLIDRMMSYMEKRCISIPITAAQEANTLA